MRTSPTYYIAPSAISITPNANESPRDLAVYIALGTKIKVYEPKINDLGTRDATYQEWTLSGRNRRLADTTGTVPYTIYARLKKVTDWSDETNIAAAHADAYLVFAPKTLNESTNEYEDPYVLSPNTNRYGGMHGTGADGKTYTWQPIPARQAENGRSGYWWVKVGEVLAVDAVTGLRTVELDTGILGTDQFNTEWDMRPDALPLRVELTCKLNGVEQGQAPFVPWSKSLGMWAHLVRGWDDDADASVHHWTITRDTGNAEADAAWNYPDTADGSDSSGSAPDGSPVGDETPDPANAHLMAAGHIMLAHSRDDADDFAGAVAATFTVTAWGEQELSDSSSSESSDSSSSGEGAAELVPLAVGVITIYAETVERYELVLSSNIVSYSPATETYSPADGVVVLIRATTQDGSVFYMSQDYIGTVGLVAEYQVADAEEWNPLTFTDGHANIAATTFAAQRPVNVHLLNADDVEVDRKTVGFVRDGEDSALREWIYYRSASASYGTAPDSIATGEVNPSGVADGTDTDKDQDGWVPNGWTDHPLGVEQGYPFEYASYRDYVKSGVTTVPGSSDSSSSGEGDGGHWGEFQTPSLWSHYGERGTDGDGVEYVFARSTTATAPVIGTTDTYSGKTYLDDDYLPPVSGASTMSGTTVVSATRTTDNPAGVTLKLPYEWVAKRTKGSPVSGVRTWNAYATGAMALWATYSEDGGTPVFRYQWNQSATTAPQFTPNAQNPGSGWSVTIPDRPGDGYYLWAISAVRNADGTYGTWGNAIRLTGENGSPGEDGSDMEYIYTRRTASTTFSGSTGPDALPANITTPDSTSTGQNVTDDDFVPNGWRDNPQGVTSTYRFEYMSWRKKPAGTNQAWGAFSSPVLWSHWGEQGIDGDGVQYVFKLYNHELTPEQRASSDYIPVKPAAPNANGEYIPDGWSDDPLSPTPSLPYCYCSAIKHINGTWGQFGELGLWSVYAESGLTMDLDNEMDAFGTDNDGEVLVQQTLTTNVSMHYGTRPQTITALSATVRRADNNSVISDTSIVQATTSGTDTTTGTVSVVVKQQSTVMLTYDLYVEITATCSIDSRSARFTLKHVSSGVPGVSPTIYQLLPSMSSMSFVKDTSSNTGYTPQNYTIKCGYVVTTGSSPASHPDDVTTGSYNIYYRKTTTGSYTKLTSNGVTVLVTDAFVEFILCANTSAMVGPSVVTGLIDRETVPVVKDGEDGVAYSIQTNVPMVSIPKDTAATVSAAPKFTATFNFYRRSGTAAIDVAYSCYSAVFWKKDSSMYNLRSHSPANYNKSYDVQSTSGSVNNVSTIFQSVSSNGFADAFVVRIYATAPTGNPTGSTPYLQELVIPIIQNGDTGPQGPQGEEGEKGDTGPQGLQGPRGQIGRSYYYAGEYSASKYYTLTAAEAPFVSVTNGSSVSYYVRIGNDGSITQGTPVSNTTYWALMNSEFKYLIAEAVLTRFAKLGSGVFNDDWMYSQYGEGTTTIWSGTFSKTVENPKQMYQIGNNTASDYGTAYNHFNVEKGKIYTVYINSTGGSAVFAIGYGPSFSTSVAEISVSANGTSVLTFLAQQTAVAYVNMRVDSGTRTVSGIYIAPASDYEKMTPSFVNSDDEVTALRGYNFRVNTTSSSPSTIAENCFYAIAGKQYDITVNVDSISGGRLYIRLYKAGSTSDVADTAAGSTNITGETTITKVIKSDYSGWVTLKAYMSSSSYSAVVTDVTIKAANPFTPKAAVDWRTGYAQFGGGRTRFLPDGSGQLAGGNITWDINGYLTAKRFSKAVYSEANAIITIGDYDMYVIPSTSTSDVIVRLPINDIDMIGREITIVRKQNYAVWHDVTVQEYGVQMQGLIVPGFNTYPNSVTFQVGCLTLVCVEAIPQPTSNVDYACVWAVKSFSGPAPLT